MDLRKQLAARIALHLVCRELVPFREAIRPEEAD
jgi:hypothetical protein